MVVVAPNIGTNGVLEVGDRLEDAAADGPAGQDREEILHGVEPRSRSWGEMESPTRIVGQPFEDLRVLVRSVVVDDGVDDLSGRNGALDGVEELDEFLVAMMRHAAPDDRAMENVERGEQGGRAVALVVMGHRPAFAGLQREAGLSAVKGLDLTFLIDRDDDRVGRRVHVEADDVLDLGGEGGIGGPFERAQAMGLEAMGVPNALDGALRNADGFRHRPSGPMGDGARRFGAGQSDNPRNDGRSDGRRAGLTGLVVKQAVHAFFGEAPLPTPDCRATDAGAPRHFQHRQPLAGKKNDFGALHMFKGTVAITDDLLETFGICRIQKDVDCLGHGRKLARIRDFVNPMTASMH